MKIYTLILSLLLTMTIFACSSSKEIQTIEQNTWKLTELNGTQESAYAEGEFFTLVFIPKEGKVAGIGACNRFFGKYYFEKGKEIDINIAGATMMAGPNMQLEQPYFDTLEEADKYVLDKDNLYLYDDDKLIAKFKKF